MHVHVRVHVRVLFADAIAAKAPVPAPTWVCDLLVRASPVEDHPALADSLLDVLRVKALRNRQDLAKAGVLRNNSSNSCKYCGAVLPLSSASEGRRGDGIDATAQMGHMMTMNNSNSPTEASGINCCINFYNLCPPSALHVSCCTNCYITCSTN
jgi:hypothetical protein